MTRSIAARGNNALVVNDELELDWESADLLMHHSDRGPGAMQLRVFSNLLYAVADTVYYHGLHVEVKLDVWEKNVHVGTGWLLNKDHPKAKTGRQSLSSTK